MRQWKRRGAVESYSRLLGPYPYTELDLAATPMLALGIEYPGRWGSASGFTTRRIGERSLAIAREHCGARDGTPVVL